MHRIATAIIRLPAIMNGRNFPSLPCVLSISAPQIGSVIPSKTRISVATVETVSVSVVISAASTIALTKLPLR